MSNTQKHILIVDGFARQTLPMVKGFKDIGCLVTVLCYSKLDVGYATKYADYKLLFNCNKEEKNKQEKYVIDLIKTGKYDMVVPMSDNAATYLANNKQFLSKYAYIAVNDKEVFELAIDKLNTMKVCQDNSISAPKTLFTNDPINDIRNSGLSFPLVIKPKTACGSIGFNIVNSYEHLVDLLRNYDGSNGELFVQEYIPQAGSQFGAEAFRDKEGNFVFLIIDEKPRWYPLDGGSPTINVTVKNEKMECMTKELLEAMNWHGYANIDFVVDARNDMPMIIEVNARISAAVKLNFCSGINVSEIIYRDAFGDDIAKYDYMEGIKTSCILTEILWFIKSPDRFKQKPTFFDRTNTTDVIFSYKDPYPFVVFCIQSVMNYRHAMEQRKRK